MIPEQPVEIHHKFAKHKGGSNSMKNLVALHKECHKVVTYTTNPLLKARFIVDKLVKEQESLSAG